MPKALIVEDEPEANELLSMLVQLRGYRTESAFTGGEALVKAERDRPDLVFLDLMLPDINGYDVCRALKSSRDTGAIPVVMVTARLADENRLQGFRVGATDYVPKPYTPDQIFVAMAEADDWTRRLAEDRAEGSIAFDARYDLAPAREVNRLRSLLLERTPLAEVAIRAIGQALVELAIRAGAWGCREGRGKVATLHYHLDDHRVVFSLEDESGWFLDQFPRDRDAFGDLFGGDRLDGMTFSRTTDRIKMVCRFQPQSEA